MTNAELIAKIKAEIERRIKRNKEEYAPGGLFEVQDNLAKLLDFIDSLEESEKPMQEGLEEEIDRFEDWMETYNQADYPTSFTTRDIARHFAKWGAEHAKIDVTDFCKPIDPSIAQCIADHSWEMLGEDEKPVPNDLEEAAWDCVLDSIDVNNPVLLPKYKELLTYLFIAGAKWQKQHDAELIEIAYNDGITIGMTKQKEQMMKEAVETDVNTYRDLVAGKSWAEFVVEMPTNNLGDKVRIIILPKED